MNKIWSYGIALSLILLLFNSSLDSNLIEIASNSIFDSLKICLELGIVYIFWCGVLEIVAELKLDKFVAKKCEKILAKLFPNSSLKEKEHIATSLSCNMLGLGNASLPAGISAIEEMQKHNHIKNSNLFIILNCISLQIVPTTIMSIYLSHAGQGFFTMWAISIVICFIISLLAVILHSIFSKRYR